MSLQNQLIAYNSRFYEHFYLCNYRPWSAGPDELSKSLIQFKNSDPLHVEAWTACSISALGKIPLRNDCFIVRALGHAEENVKLNTPLDILGNKIAERFHGRYLPTLLKKRRQTKKVTRLKAHERTEELANVYSFENEDEVNEILIIDDILTTGSTVRAIIEAITSVTASVTIQIFTLASSDQQALMNKSIELISPSYEWELSDGWQRVAEEGPYSLELEKLKNTILNDSF